MTGYKVMKRTRMCFGRTDGQSDHYKALATNGTMWRGPDNLLHVLLTLMYPLEVITSF
jgi:hypothetical protein